MEKNQYYNRSISEVKTIRYLVMFYLLRRGDVLNGMFIMRL